MKRSIKTAALIVAALLVFCACGGGKGLSYDEGRDPAGYTVNKQAGSIKQTDGDMGFTYEELSKDSSVAPDARDNTKVIHTAALSLQTTEFEKTVGVIEAFVIEKGGNMESESLNNGSFGNSSMRYRTARFTARIPAENYESFLSGMNDKCHVVSLTRNTQDVGEQYFDTEQRLETLRNKHERLEALLKQAKEMNDIIALETELSNTEYEINRYTSTLNRYDSLIGFSTVNITLEEVYDPDVSVTEDPGFFERLGKSFKRGVDNFADSMEDLVMWLSYNIIGIIVFVVIIIVLIKTKPVARLRKRLGGGKKSIPGDGSGSEKG